MIPHLHHDPGESVVEDVKRDHAVDGQAALRLPGNEGPVCPRDLPTTFQLPALGGKAEWTKRLHLRGPGRPGPRGLSDISLGRRGEEEDLPDQQDHHCGQPGAEGGAY